MTLEQAPVAQIHWRGLARRGAAAATRSAFVRSVPLRAFLASRVLVLLAGAVGVLIPSRRAAAAFIPAGLSPHFGTLGNVLLGPVVRWDATYYLAIASHGYTTTKAGSPAFFPLYPLLVRALSYLTGSEAIAGVGISTTAFAVALVLLHRLTELELGTRAADVTVLLVAFAPLSFFFSAVYTESLFLLLSVGALLAARRERWWLAGVLGALATVTRVTGLLLIVPVVMMQLRSRRRGRQLGWVLLLPAALLAYLAVLAANGFAWLAPFHAQSAWGRRTVGPLWGIAAAVVSAVRSVGAIVGGLQPIYRPTRFGPFTPSAESCLLLLVLLVACLVLVSCFRKLPLVYGAYAAAALLMCVSSPAIGQPLQSFDRYGLTIFPLWMAAGAWIAERRLVRVAVAAGVALLAFYTFWFSRWSFIA